MTSVRPSCLIRFDASPDVGGGHAMRCLTLAGSLAGAGWDVTLAWRDPTRAMVPGLAAAGLRSLRIDGPVAEEPQRLAAEIPGGVDMLVVDHYERGRSFEQACRGWARRIAVLEDQPDRGHDCDLLIDPTLGRDAAAYTPLVPGGCRVLAGTEYALLRPAFARARATALERRGGGRPVERLLISFGMADPDDISSVALAAIAESGVAVAVDVVLGADAPHRRGVEKAHAALPGGGVVHAFVDDMAALMVAADLAIGGAGSTAWERCCLGLPALVFVLADNQQDIAEGLAERGAAESLGEPDDTSAARLAAQLGALVARPDRLAAMSEAAAAICDGRGAGRVAETFTAVTEAA